MNILFVIFTLLILFSNAVGRIIPTSHIDELTFVISMVLGSFLMIKNNTNFKNVLKIWFAMFGVILLGVFSTLIHSYQTNIYPIVKDTFMLLKAPVTFFYAVEIIKYLDKDKIKDLLIKAIKILTVVIFVFGIFNLFFDLGMDEGTRNGIKTYKFLFTHPTYLVYTLVLFIVFLFTRKKFDCFILMNLITLVLTFRDKAYFFIVIYLFALMYLLIKEKGFRQAFVVLGPLIGFVLINIISFEKLMKEYIIYGTSTARGALYIYGLDYALKFFPFGTGFGTWASSISGEYYSALYYERTMQFIPGLAPDNYAYITDTFWPYIYTQFGFIGLALYIYCFYLIFKFVIDNNKENKLQLRAVILLIGYCVIASLFEGLFTNETGVYTMVILALLNKTPAEEYVKEQRYEGINLLQQKRT